MCVYYIHCSLPCWSCGWYSTNCCGHNQININLTQLSVLFSRTEQVLLCIIFNFGLPRMLESFLMYLSSQLPFLDAIWWGEWYLTNGSGYNQMKIYLTILNDLVIYNRSFHVEFLIFVFQGCWRPFEGFLNHNCLFWDANGFQTRYFAQQMGAGTNTIKLIWWYRITKLMMGSKFFCVEIFNSTF
jgi:hypothetical protein